MSGAASPLFTIRLVTEAHRMKALEAVQIAAWGYPDREVLPGTMLRISAATGGIVLAAYLDGSGPDGPGSGSGAPFGLAYGFPAFMNGQHWHHSHLLAVAPEWRGSGAAPALKRAQAHFARAQGHSRMTWTFDPLVTRNARLNLGKLGARAVSYHPDWYDLGGPVPADRLMIEWDLDREHVEAPAPLPEGETVLSAVGLEPGVPRLGRAEARLLVEVPMNADTLPDGLRLRWRLALRAVLGGYLARGYAVTQLAREGERAWYVLENSE